MLITTLFRQISAMPMITGFCSHAHQNSASSTALPAMAFRTTFIASGLAFPARPCLVQILIRRQADALACWLWAPVALRLPLLWQENHTIFLRQPAGGFVPKVPCSPLFLGKTLFSN